MRSTRWALIQDDWCPCKNGELGTDSHIQEQHVIMKTAIYKPGREAWTSPSHTTVLRRNQLTQELSW